MYGAIYLNHVWFWIKSTLTADRGLALSASVVVGRLFGAHVELDFTEWTDG